MDLMKTEYEFLDLSDVKDTELSSLQCALFEQQPEQSAAALTNSWTEPTIADLSSCSSSTVGPPTVSSSLDSLSGGECEMAPHSPQRGGTVPSSGPPPQHGPPPPPPYVQPPPPYGPPPPQQWPVAPPNVYVSQVTANVNVHGYMGQYYQPAQPQYVPPGAQLERPQRNHRRDRRGKRPPSPPPSQPPPYYVQYPPYYAAAQAQGTPLYHVPMYQPVTYVGHYPYHPYYEYPMPVDGEGGEKGPDEYPQEVMMEQEAVEAYYAGAHYGGPHYGPPVEGPVEYMPHMYLPPPSHPPPMSMPQQMSHPTTPHQFNVHAKNFVQNQTQNKTYILQEKSIEPKTPPVTSLPAATVSVASLPIKDLKLNNKGPSSPKTNEVPIEAPPQLKSTIPLTEKVLPTPKVEVAKTTWTPTEIKVTETAGTNTSTQSQIAPVKPLPTNLPSSSQPAVVAKSAPTPVIKMTKGPAAPFSGNKATAKAPMPPTAVPVQQNVSIPKPPFGNRQKREAMNARSPSGDTPDNQDRQTATVEQQAKREPLLPPSKAPMPISITLHSQGQPVIVTNKLPFSHSRKALTAPEPPPVPQPPPPAPTASDFPPPPTPRNRVEPVPSPIVQQPQPAPGKSWASLFSNKSTIGSTCLTTPTDDTINSINSTVVITNVQKPVAKVPPYDASPLLQTAVLDKNSSMVKPIMAAAQTISYSEKTSVNALSNTIAVMKSASPTTSEVREIPVQKDAAPTSTVPSPYADDPNSYRMGEFLSKYQLDNRPVALLPRGLTNRSNYCYVNAILQALIACPPFYNMLKALPYQTRRGKSSTPVIDAMVELCYEFTPLPPNSRASRTRGSEGAAGALPVQTGAPLDPSAGQKVLRALRPFPGSQEGRQEDAEEFLGCLLNGLNDEMLELMKLVEPDELKDIAQTNGVITQEVLPEEEDDDDEWKVMGPKNKGAIERRWSAGRTPLSDIFRGRTRCRTHRAPLHDVTDAVQPFFTLQLDMERANNVKDALELLAGKDSLEGVSDAWQQLSVEQLPVVLLLHLKCFQLNAEGHTAKIVKNFDFPIDLKIDPKVMSSKLKYTNKQRSYKLFAVVYHEGVEAVKGHYLTDTFHGQAGWIRYDDSTVTLVTDAQVLKPKPPRMPYLLMYRRQDTLPVPHRSTPKLE